MLCDGGAGRLEGLGVLREECELVGHGVRVAVWVDDVAGDGHGGGPDDGGGGWQWQWQWQWQRRW